MMQCYKCKLCEMRVGGLITDIDENLWRHLVHEHKKEFRENGKLTLEEMKDKFYAQLS